MSAIRLTFDVVDGKPSLRNLQRLQMRVPPQQKYARTDSGHGLWLELRDAEGKVLYCRILHAEALTMDAETRTGASDQPFSRRVAEHISSLFTAVVPDHPEARSFHIMERRRGKADGKAVELVGTQIGKTR